MKSFLQYNISIDMSSKKQKEIDKKRKLYVIIVLVVAVVILIADLVLFWTSLEQEGEGRGFSRYWCQEK